MDRRAFRVSLLAGFLVFILACTGIPSNPVDPSPMVPDPLPTVFIQPSPPEATPLPEEANTPAPQDPQQSASDAGILVQGNQLDTLQVYSLEGQLLGEIQLPGLVPFAPQFVHAYGLQNQDISTLSVIYYARDAGVIRLSTRNQTQDLMAVPALVHLQGFPKQPLIIFGTGNFQDAAFTTELNTASFSGEPQLQSHISVMSSDSKTYVPAAVFSNDGEPQGAWFTMENQDLLGSSFYPQKSGLYYLDLASGNIHWLFNDQYLPSDISEDGKFAAIVSNNPADHGMLQIYDLDSLSIVVEYPLMMGQDLGAGYAVISSDNTRVAWVESGGEYAAAQPTFHALLRFAAIRPDDIPYSMPASDIAVSTLPYDNATVKPLAWLSNEALLVEASTIQQPHPALYIVETTQDTVRKIVDGNFMGFINQAHP